MLDRQHNPRAHYIHRIRYTTQERMVGSFVLLALALLLWLTLSSGKTADLFEEKLTLYGTLDSAQAVNKGTRIMVSGLAVGEVTAVDVTDDNRIVLTMKILKQYHNLLRSDSSARLNSPDIAVLGSATIDITAGSPDAPLLADGSTLIIDKAPSLADAFKKVEPTFVMLQDSIARINDILQQIDPVLINDTLSRFNQTSRHLENISASVRDGEGAIHGAIYDREMQQKLQTTLANMERASLEINRLLDTLNSQAGKVPQLLDKVEPILRETDRTLRATQRIWPLSTAVGNDADKPTLTPAAPVND